MSIKIEIKNLPEELKKRGLEEKLAKICKEEDIIFIAEIDYFNRREETKENDIDIAIEFAKNSGKSLLDLVRIEDELTRIFKRKVDLGIFSSLNPYIKEDIKKEMQTIYEKR